MFRSEQRRLLVGEEEGEGQAGERKVGVWEVGTDNLKSVLIRHEKILFNCGIFTI